jgi:hypothetical protein
MAAPTSVLLPSLCNRSMHASVKNPSGKTITLDIHCDSIGSVKIKLQQRRSFAGNHLQQPTWHRRQHLELACLPAWRYADFFKNTYRQDYRARS